MDRLATMSSRCRDDHDRRRSRAGGKGSFEGFTLIECLVGLTLAGVLVSAAAPPVRKLTQSFALWGGIRMVETSLQWGRSHAIAANTGLALIVDSDGKRFYWTDAYTGDRYEGTVRYLPVGIRITSSPRRPLRFYQRGNAVPAGTFVVQGEAGSWRVIVSPSGRIRTQRD
jgi:prepilin-type N-terminal cleavage/methylation domain-containing protein